MIIVPQDSVEIGVRPSEKNGLGLFSLRSFEKNAKLLELKGELCTVVEIHARKDRKSDNTIRFAKDLYLNPEGYFPDFLNHSCDPNCKIVKIDNKLLLFSLSTINKEEELLIDYSTIIVDDDEWELNGCSCGSAVCRKRIGKFSQLSNQLQEDYKERKVVPDYILEILET